MRAALRWRPDRFCPVLGGVLLFPLLALLLQAVELPALTGDKPAVQSGTAKLPDEVIVLTREKYQEMRDEIARLKGLAGANKPVAPTSCKLAARVEGDTVRLRAQFGFATYKPRTLVALGCKQANPTAAALDGQLPLLQWSDDGWVVLVDKADTHELTLDLELLVTSKGPDRAIDLSLPGAAITTLELELPEEVKTVRVAGHPTATRAGDDRRSRLVRALGAAERLDLVWQGPAVRPGVAPLLAAEGRITVQVTETSLITRADLTLQVLSGQTDEFRLLVPPQAEVKPPVAEEPQKTLIQAIEAPDPGGPLRIIRLKEASAEPVRVQVQVSQPRPGGTALVPIRPLVLLGAAQQRGTLLIGKSPDLQLRYNPRGEPRVTLVPRDLTDEERKSDPNLAAAFRYWSVAAPAKPSQPVPPILELEIEKIKGALEARVTHTLRLLKNEGDGRSFWRVQTRIEVTPIRTVGVDYVLVQLPPAADYQYDAGVGVQPTLIVQGVDPIDPLKRVARVVLERQVRAFSIVLEGSYPLLGPDAQETTLKLPYPLGTLDRGAEVKAFVPAEVKLVPAKPDDPFWEAAAGPEVGPRPEKPQATHEHGWLARRIPEQVELAWRPYRPELPVDNVLDLDLAGRQVQVTQALTFRTGQVPAEVLLRVPEDLVEAVEVVGLGKLTRPQVAERLPLTRAGFETWRVELKGKTAKSPLTLKYFFKVAEKAATDAPERARHTLQFDVLLVRPEQATHVDTTVRVWAAPGALVAPAGDRWEEVPIRAVRDRESLPDLVLAGSGLELPLSLRVNEPAVGALATVLVERALIRVTVNDDGSQVYRTSFLVSQPQTPYLDLELPASTANLLLKRVALRIADEAGGAEEKLLKPVPINETGQVVNASKIVRLSFDPGLVRRQAVLELEYQLSPSRPGGLAGMMQSALQPPVFRGDIGRFPVRWQIGLPASWLPLGQEGGLATDQRWGMRGWLFGPRAGRTPADLEREFYPEALRPRLEGNSATLDQGRLPALIVTTFSLEPLRVSHVPQQGWLLICSGVLIALTLALYLLSSTRLWFWSIVALLGPALLVAGLFWPTLFASIAYGCEPGLVVLLLVFGVQWTLQQRYRRQVVFMPGFKRVKTGSSLIRGGSSHRPAAPVAGHAEPSTVDAPALPGTGAWAGEAGARAGSSNKK